MSRRFNLRDLRKRTIPVPNAPDVWNFTKYGNVLCGHDYHARLVARLVPGFWELWVDACRTGMHAAVIRTKVMQTHPALLPPSYRKAPDEYYVQFGAKWVAERIRWGYFVERVEDVNAEYAVPNNCTAYWARLSIKENPDWAPFIEMRECKTVKRDNGYTHSLVVAGKLPTP